LFSLSRVKGDFCIYRNTLWHCGVYHPRQPRATIHDGHVRFVCRFFRTHTHTLLLLLLLLLLSGCDWFSNDIGD
jgi:hypothetical protein